MIKKFVRSGSWSRRLTLLAALVLGAAMPSSAQVTINEHRIIAPISIPVNTTGVVDIGMARLKLRNDGASDVTVTQVQLAPLTDYPGGFSTTWISNLGVYLEAKGVVDAGEWDHGFTTKVDQLVSTGYVWNSGNGTYDVTIGAAGVLPTGGGGWNHMYAVIDLSTSAPTSTNLGLKFTSLTHTGPGSPVTPADPPQATNGLKQNIDDYTVTAGATGKAPTAAKANDTNVPVLLLNLSLADASTTAYLGSVKVRRLGGQDNWVTGNGVLLYADDGDGSFEPGADDGAALATATLGALTAGYATLTVNPSAAVPASGKSFWVALNLNSVYAVVEQTLGLEVQNPATDVTFVDEIQDDNDILPSEYAYVRGNDSGLYEYNQTAFVNPASTSAIPSSGNTFTVNPADDLQPPTVLNTTPSNGLSGVARSQDLSVVFSEWMDKASVENVSNFTLSPAAAHTLSYNTTNQTLTVDITGLLTYGQTYTATVKSAVLDYYGTAMAADYSWTFTVVAESFPTVTATTPTTGATDVMVDSDVRAVFSEIMDPATLSGANFTLVGSVSGPVAGSVSPGTGNQSLVFTPSADLEYNETYTATVTTGVKDAEGSSLQANYVWSFTTIRLYPEFTEPVIIRNKIVSGGNQQALIFVTQPPGGPADRVTVQVFTNTGKRVATLVNSAPFNTITSPILWEGVNGKGQPLGPGLYYVQIRATNYKRVLKVLIVR